MKKPEDKFIYRIQEVFEEYQDDSADFGWEKFEKLREKERPVRPFILWLTSAAAIFLMACGVWFFNSNMEKSNVVVKKTEPIKEKLTNNVSIIKPLPEKAVSIAGAGNLDVPDRKLKVISQKGSVVNMARSGKTNNKNTDNALFSAIESNTKIRLNTNRVDNITAGNEQELSKNSKKPDTITIKAIDRESNTALVQEKASTLPSNPSIAVNKSAEQLSKITPNKKISPNKGNKAVALSVYAGTHFNYSKGSENSLNLGFGLSSDIKLTKNLKLSTGIAIAQNTLKYSSENNLPSNTLSGFVSTLNGSFKGGMDASPILSNSFGAATASKLNDFNANLLSLDIPINIKYQVLSKKNKLYVLTGLSSGTYLSEVYTYKYNQSYLAGSQVILDNQGSGISSKSSNNFYLARTLNISAGLSTPLTKTQDLTIEPFIKYPLGGLGEQQIKFGAAGINLKLNFNTVSKK